MMEIRFDGVEVRRAGRLVLDVPSLEIRSGVVTAILGPNGSGKTTLLRTVAGLGRPARGRITMAGREVRGRKDSREAIAFAFQAPVFLSGTVAGNLDLALRLRGVPSTMRRGRVEDAAAALGVSDLLGRDVRRISGGERQRVNLARAVVTRAPVLLLDEPLAGMDAPSRERLMQDLPVVLRASGSTVLLVTHERDEAAWLAEDVVLLLGGRVHAAGPVPAVFGHPPDGESAAFLGWTVWDEDGGIVAVPPGALSPGSGEVNFRFVAERVIHVGSRWEAAGRIGAALARVTGTGAAPGCGELRVSAPADVVIRYQPSPNVKLHESP